MSDGKGYFGACSPHDFPLLVPAGSPAYWIGGTIGQTAPPAGYPVSFKKFFEPDSRVSSVKLSFNGVTHDNLQSVLVLLSKPDPFERRIRRGSLMRGCLRSFAPVGPISFSISSGSAVPIPVLASQNTGGPYAATIRGSAPVPDLGIWPVGFDDFIGAVATGCWFVYVQGIYPDDSGQIAGMELSIST